MYAKLHTIKLTAKNGASQQHDCLKRVHKDSSTLPKVWVALRTKVRQVCFDN